MVLASESIGGGSITHLVQRAHAFIYALVQAVFESFPSSLSLQESISGVDLNEKIANFAEKLAKKSEFIHSARWRMIRSSKFASSALDVPQLTHQVIINLPAVEKLQHAMDENIDAQLEKYYDERK